MCINTQASVCILLCMLANMYVCTCGNTKPNCTKAFAHDFIYIYTSFILKMRDEFKLIVNVS